MEWKEIGADLWGATFDGAVTISALTRLYKLMLAEAAVARGDIVPGVMRCARCKFKLTRVNLYVNSGTTGAGNSQTEPCPNGCGPLWPVTWEQEAREGYETMERLFVRAEAAEKATVMPIPLTADQVVRLWHLDAETHSKDCAFDWFAAGVAAAERAHKVTVGALPDPSSSSETAR